MEIKNLLKSDVAELEKKIGDLRRENPDIRYKVFEMEKEKPDVSEKLEEILGAIKTIQESINLIFADHVLINGRWENINKIAELMRKYLSPQNWGKNGVKGGG